MSKYPLAALPKRSECALAPPSERAKPIYAKEPLR
jgi:hypothetical protein